MTLLAVKWYEYAGQEDAWRAFWHDVCLYLPICPAPSFFEGPTARLWETGAYDLTWACGGDVALNPRQFCPLVVPVFGPAATDPGTYQSLILRLKKAEDRQTQDQRSEDPRPKDFKTKDLKPQKRRIGINGPLSTSGHLALAHWWHGQGYAAPQQVIITGGHEASVQALLAQQIDMAAIDSQGWHLLQRAYPALAHRVTVEAKTRILPAPPLCIPGHQSVSQSGQAQAWRDGFAAANRALQNGELHDHGLGITGFVPAKDQAYKDLALELKKQISAGQVLCQVP